MLLRRLSMLVCCMRKIAFGMIVILVLLSACCFSVSAQGTIEVAQGVVPLPEGTRSLKTLTMHKPDARMITFMVDQSLDEVIAFYEAFFNKHSFAVMGGQDAQGYNAAVKMNESMFTLKIYRTQAGTTVEFIW